MKRKLLLLYFLVLTVVIFSSCGKNSSTKATDEALPEVPSETMALPQEIPKEEIIEYRTSFIGCGDNIIYGTKDARNHAKGTDAEFDYKPYYDGVKDIIKNADISFINQETLMCGDGYSLSYYPMFNSPRQVGINLKELGFDVVNISNNHMLDKGADGLSATISFWKNMEDVLMIGGYENEEDFYNIRFIEKNGIKIAFLSYTYATNGLTKPSSSPIVIPYINDEDIIRQTALAKECADMIFVSVHWGKEGSFTPNDEQKRVAQLFADCGVDAIIGHHPHVIQPVEWLYGKDGNKTLCVFSLGNFMAQQAYDYNMIGGIISFDIVHSKVKAPTLENVKFLPTVFHFGSSFTGNNVMLFENYTAELCSLHGVRTYYGHRMDYSILEGYIRNTIDKEFLPEYYHGNNQEYTE